jgi:hypothetical protein
LVLLRDPSQQQALYELLSFVRSSDLELTVGSDNHEVEQ